jgi:hypothetical protein
MGTTQYSQILVCGRAAKSKRLDVIKLKKVRGLAPAFGCRFDELTAVTRPSKVITLYRLWDVSRTQLRRRCWGNGFKRCLRWWDSNNSGDGCSSCFRNFFFNWGAWLGVINGIASKNF